MSRASSGISFGDLKAEVIGRDPFVLALPPRHPLARHPGPAALAEHRGASVLLLDDGHCLREQALAVCAHARADELGFRATSLPTLAQMVSAGAGVTASAPAGGPDRRSPLGAGDPAAGRSRRPADAGAGLAADIAAGAGVADLAATIRERFERVMADAGKDGRRVR